MAVPGRRAVGRAGQRTAAAEERKALVPVSPPGRLPPLVLHEGKQHARGEREGEREKERERDIDKHTNC